MIKINKNQRDQLIAIGLGTTVVIACLCYLVMRAQYQQLAVAEAKCANMQRTLRAASDKTRQAEAVAGEEARYWEMLNKRQTGLAPEREPFSWLAATLRDFRSHDDGHHYKSITIADIKPPETSDKGVISGFPYKWARFHVLGEGHYHDFGRFIADFENAFPYACIQNLDIGVPNVRGDADMLGYNFDVVAPQVPMTEEKR